MIGLRDYKVSEGVNNGKRFYFVNLGELNLNLNDMLKRFEVFQEFCKRFHISNEELAEYVVKCCIPDKSLFDFSVCSYNGYGYLLAKEGVYTEKQVREYGGWVKQINKYDVYVVPNEYCKLALNKIATRVMFDKFPFMKNKEFTKEVKRFNEKIHNLPTDVNTLIGDIDADIIFENKLTIKDLIEIYTNRNVVNLTKSESLFTIYEDGNIYLKINEYQSLYLKSDDFFNHDWVAVLEREVFNIPLVDENGDRKPYAWFDGKQKDAQYINNELVNILAFEMDIQPDTIMNTTNSHNKELVDKINALWASHGNPYDTDLFKYVIKALFERDIDEANGKELTHEFFERDFEGFMQMFLMNICDDSDLQWIIDYFSKLSYEKYS